MKDYRGNKIEIGSIVAFNKSGKVKIGIVRGFGKPTNKRWIGNGKYAMIPDIHVEADDSPNAVSKVKYSESLVVLQELFPFDFIK